MPRDYPDLDHGWRWLAAYLRLPGGTTIPAFRRFRPEGGWRGARADLLVGVVLVVPGFGLAGLFEDSWGDTEVKRLVPFVLAIPQRLAPGAGDARKEAA